MFTATLEAKTPAPVRKNLAEFAPGQAGVVTEILGQADLTLRMMEIGLVPGVRVRYLRAAPLGDPIQVEVEGFLLSLRKSEAEAVILNTSERE